MGDPGTDQLRFGTDRDGDHPDRNIEWDALRAKHLFGFKQANRSSLLNLAVDLPARAFVSDACDPETYAVHPSTLHSRLGVGCPVQRSGLQFCAELSSGWMSVQGSRQSGGTLSGGALQDQRLPTGSPMLENGALGGAGIWLEPVGADRKEFQLGKRRPHLWCSQGPESVQRPATASTSKALPFLSM